MAEENTIMWSGQSGRQYKYWYSPMPTFKGKDQPGNYIFARWTGTGWRPVYIGETESLKDRCCSLMRSGRRRLGVAQRTSMHTPAPQTGRLA
jgi:hypothetical protein